MTQNRSDRKGIFQRIAEFFNPPTEEVKRVEETRKQERKTYAVSVLKSALPVEAKDFTYLGGSWCSYSLEIAGKRRVFMMHYSDGLGQPPTILELHE